MSCSDAWKNASLQILNGFEYIDWRGDNGILSWKFHISYNQQSWVLFFQLHLKAP